MPVVWLAAKQAAVCSAGEALGGIDVHMQGIAGCWAAARALRSFWVVPRAKSKPKIRTLLSLALVIVSSEDLYLLSLSRIMLQVHLHHLGMCVLGIFVCLFVF